MNIKVTTLEDARVEIEGEIATDVFMAYKARAVEFVGRDMEVPGFRKGKAPANVIEQSVQPSRILEEMAEMALSEHYPQILKDNNIDALGRPEIMITKLANDNPLGFKIKTEVMPVVTLPDYKKIAKESIGSATADTTVTEDEFEKAILEIRQMRAHQKMHDDGIEHENHNHTETKEEDLPPLDEDFVKSLGNFEHVEDFKTKLRTNIAAEKESKHKEKIRMDIIDALIDKTAVVVPAVFTEVELNKMFARLESDIENAGFKFDEYLTQLGKTVEDIRKEWRPDAEKRAKMEIIIHKIAEVEKLAPDAEVLKKEVEALMNHYKGVDHIRAEAYVLQMLTAQKVFELLEGTK